jgi:hypothetical protein
VENYSLVQRASIVNAFQPKKPALVRGFSQLPQSSRTAAWRRCARPCGNFTEQGKESVNAPRRIGRGPLLEESSLKIKDPSGGTTGRVKP